MQNRPRHPRRTGACRTPLFGALRRAVRLAGRADRPDAPPVAELVEQDRAARWSRRDALRASAALALGGVPLRADEAPPRRAAKATDPRIVVVGAGIAGLRAAYELKKAGLRARVFEAGTRTGGRILTVKDVVAPGLITELGGEYVDSDHREMRALVQEFGLELLDTRSERGLGLVGETYFFGGAHRTEAEAVDAFRPIAARIEDDIEDLGAPETFRDDPEAREYDETSISEYLDEVDARGWIRDLIEVAYGSEYGLDCGEQSALNLLTMVSTDLDEDGFTLYDSDERYKIRGGSGQVVDGLARRLDGQIEFEHRLESIREAGAALRLDFAGPGGRTVRSEADFVVLAVPFSVLRRVEIRVGLPPTKARAIAELGYGTNAKVVAGFDRRVWRGRGYLGAVYSDEPFGSAWDHTRLQPGTAAGLTLFPAGRAGVDAGAGTAAAQAARLLQGVEKVYPGTLAAHNGRSARHHWPSAPFALGSYACYKPGQWTTIGGTEAAPVGNLYFAGEHCAFPEAGYMDSGAASGRDAARALLARLEAR